MDIFYVFKESGETVAGQTKTSICTTTAPHLRQLFAHLKLKNKEAFTTVY